MPEWALDFMLKLRFDFSTESHWATVDIVNSEIDSVQIEAVEGQYEDAVVRNDRMVLHQPKSVIQQKIAVKGELFGSFGGKSLVLIIKKGSSHVARLKIASVIGEIESLIADICHDGAGEGAENSKEFVVELPIDSSDADCNNETKVAGFSKRGCALGCVAIKHANDDLFFSINGLRWKHGVMPKRVACDVFLNNVEMRVDIPAGAVRTQYSPDYEIYEFAEEFFVRLVDGSQIVLNYGSGKMNVYYNQISEALKFLSLLGLRNLLIAVGLKNGFCFVPVMVFECNGKLLAVGGDINHGPGSVYQLLLEAGAKCVSLEPAIFDNKNFVFQFPVFIVSPDDWLEKVDTLLFRSYLKTDGKHSGISNFVWLTCRNSKESSFEKVDLARIMNRYREQQLLEICRLPDQDQCNVEKLIEKKLNGVKCYDFFFGNDKEEAKKIVQNLLRIF